jgi:hypothetical protein
VAIEINKAVTRAITEQANLLDKRFPGYQEQVVLKVVEIVAGQIPTDVARRKAISAQVSLLADSVSGSAEKDITDETA